MVAASQYQLVSVSVEDGDFLFKLYAQTFGKQFLNAGLPQEMVAMLIRQQFALKQTAYQKEFPEAEHSIIIFRGESAGQIRLNKSENEIHIIDISILPEQQRKGLAGSVIQGILMSEDRKNKKVKLSVERGSAAQALYKKLEFDVVEETAVYIRMVNHT